MVSPTLALSMKFDGSQQQKAKPPVSWTVEDEGSQKGGTLDLKSDPPPLISKVIEPSRKTDATKKPAIITDSSLNRALQPRGGKPVVVTSENPRPTSSKTSSKAMSLGEFLSSSKESTTSVLGKRPKQPPPVKPKPQRRSTGSAPMYSGAGTGSGATVPSQSELTKTLSSWKKSRVVKPGIEVTGH